MATLGQREDVTFQNFTGIALQPGLYPEVFVPRDIVGAGTLLDARNLRFSQGRAYWHRNQVRVLMPDKISVSGIDCNIVSMVSTTNTITVTTDVPHGLLVGEQIFLTSSGSSLFNGLRTITARPSTTTFQYYQFNPTGTVSDGTVVPTRATLFYEFVADGYNQMLCISDDGIMRRKNVDWSGAPTQWGYGWSMASGPYADVATGLPTYPIRGIANVDNNLILAAGAGTGFATGMPMKCWDGATLSDVGLPTPIAFPTAAADATGTGNVLDDGTYSYRFTFGNAKYESMQGPITDCIVKATPAIGYIEPKTTTTALAHHDTVTIDGQTYRFVLEATMVAAGETLQVGDIILWADAGTSAADKLVINFRSLAHAVYVGGNWSRGGVTAYTPPLQNCNVYWSYPAGGVPRIWFYAKEKGTAGNAITIVENTADGRFHKSGATLSGGIGLCNIDLSNIKAGPTGTTWRKVYRAYTTATAAGNRGTDFNYLGTINNNTATTYEDNTLQGDVGEPMAFDHARPPQGDLIVSHRDRLWLAGVAQTSDSYRYTHKIAAAPTGASYNGSYTLTITTTEPHGFAVGDVVTLEGITNSQLNTIPADGPMPVLTVPSPTTFTLYHGLFGGAATSGSGSASVYEYGTRLSNILFYSQLDQPFYWPAFNQITVGNSSPITALVTWHDQLLIFKADSVWLLSGYGEDDWNLVRIPGLTGAIGNHSAASPFGVMYAGHSGWMLWDGEQSRTIVEYQEATDFTDELPTISPPCVTGDDNLRAPAVCFHGDRFHIWGGSHFLYAWHPETNSWEVSRRNISATIGLRSFASTVYQSHILALMEWGSLDTHTKYLTALDSLYKPTTGSYGNSTGTLTDVTYGEVLVELAPVVAPGGELVNPLEIWVKGQWTKPADDAKDLKLEIYSDATAAWVSIGTITANGRRGIPSGYATGRLRLRLHGAAVPFFVLQSVRLVFQRRAARG